jgi:hypothetical protein
VSVIAAGRVVPVGLVEVTESGSRFVETFAMDADTRETVRRVANALRAGSKRDR